jgi:hypothetical protein
VKTSSVDAGQPTALETVPQPARSAASEGANPPAVQTANTAAPEHAPEHRRDSHARDDREFRQRAASEPEPALDVSAEQVHQPRFQSAASVTTTAKPLAPAGPVSPVLSIKSADSPRIEPEAQTQSPPAAHSSDSHSISLRVTDAGDQRVDLTVTDHAGQVRVQVRAADTDLAGTLRDNLGDLVHRLEQNGLRADSWHSTAADHSDGPRPMRQPESAFFSGGQSGRQAQEDHPGSGQRRQQDPQRPAWFEEFEGTSTPESERSTIPWQST